MELKAGQRLKEQRMSEGSEVVLAVYDLSHGMAKQYLSGLLGISVEAIYHTGVRVYGYEYFYSDGIQKMHPDEVFAVVGVLTRIGGAAIRNATHRSHPHGRDGDS